MMKKIKQWYRDLYETYMMEENYDYMVKEKTHPFILWAIKAEYPRLVCKIFGHKWKSIDYGDAESGGIGVECIRCGEYHFQHLY